MTMRMTLAGDPDGTARQEPTRAPVKTTSTRAQITVDDETAWIPVPLDVCESVVPLAACPQKDADSEEAWILTPVPEANDLLTLLLCESPAVTSTAAQPAPVAQRRSRKNLNRQTRGLAQDDWDFFDPDRCGFAVLLAKFAEVTGR